MHKGSCLCGAVTFEVACKLKPPDACHCTECRKFSGHYFTSTDVPKAAVTIRGEDRVSWYRHHGSEKVSRGFCSVCGSSMFFDALKHDWIGIAMGCFEPPTDTQLAIHIFVGNKGDYYEIKDGLPQNLA